MAARDKKQCPIRFPKDEFERIREKASNDGLSYQQLGEVLFGAYLKSNKEIVRLVIKYVDSKKNSATQLTELEKDDLLRLIENESPAAKLEKDGKNEK